MSFDDYHNSGGCPGPSTCSTAALLPILARPSSLLLPRRRGTAPRSRCGCWARLKSHDHNMISMMPSFTSLIARESGPNAMARAGITHDDIDLTMIYDSFTYTVMLTLEALGFCGPGEAADFVAGQRTAPGGDFP